MVWIGEITPQTLSRHKDAFQKHLNAPRSHNFVLIFLEGCPPCEATRPEWGKLKNALPDDMLGREDVVIGAIDQSLLSEFENWGSDPTGFPTIRYITDGGNRVETYEDAPLMGDKTRTIDSFVEWVNSKANNQSSSNYYSGGRKRTSSRSRPRSRSSRRWTIKYKRSISCRRPKGFSQRQYCKSKKLHRSKKTKKRRHYHKHK